MTFFRKKLIDPTPTHFGVDISDLSVKVLQMTRRGAYDEVVGFATGTLPPGAVTDGVIMDDARVAATIDETRKRAKLSCKNVVCSLPESKSFLRIVTIPRMPCDEVAEAIKWEIEAVIPLSIDQVYYDWQVLPQSLSGREGQMDVVVVAVAKKYVDHFIDMLQAAGLTAHGFDVESVAQANSLLPADEKGVTTMIIDIGDKGTSFVITVDGIPVFTSSIPLSAESLTKIIEQTLGISHQEAEKIKVMYGIGSVLNDDHIFQATKSVVENFVVEAQKSIDFYLSRMRYSRAIDRIVMCGGGAKTIGLAPYLSRRLHYDIAKGDPWVNMRFRGVPPVPYDEAVQYATVIGLAGKQLA